jgi:hypothetical protein
VGPLKKNHPAMDAQTNREIWLLTIGTIIVEVPVVMIAALATLTR